MSTRLTSGNIPQGSADTQGRYRLLTVATDTRGNKVQSHMILVDASGNKVWEGMMNSGGTREYLPGLLSSLAGQNITAEYPINWNDVRLNRADNPDMSYSDGSPGYSITIENASNIARLGGVGRNLFRIHPGGRTVTTSGCLEFIDANGNINTASDQSARSFLRAMQQIPENQRPRALEIVNPDVLSGTPGASAQVDAAQRERNERLRSEVENQAAVASSGLAGFGDTIMQLIMGFFQFLMEALTGSNNGDGRDDVEPDPSDSNGTGSSLFNGIRATGAAARSWASYQRTHANQRVVHRSPMEGASNVGDDRAMRERHPIHGDRRMHHGIDMTPGEGNTDSSPNILASANGVVLYSGTLRGYGKTVIIGHADGTYSLYAHMTGTGMPAAGSEVRQGQVIGEMGQSGGATGPHLHYEQRRGSQSIVPLINGAEIERGARLTGTAMPNLAALGVTGNGTPAPTLAMRNPQNTVGAAYRS